MQGGKGQKIQSWQNGPWALISCTWFPLISHPYRLLQSLLLFPNLGLSWYVY